MSGPKNGGRAFPAQLVNNSTETLLSPDGEVLPPGTTWYDVGMSLRDYFAAMAMQGWVADGTGDPQAAAEYGYRVADEMLRVRSE